MSTYQLETGKGGQEVTPGTPFPECRGLWVGTTGDVEVAFASGGSTIYKNVTGLLPVNAVNVLIAGTSASDITTLV